MVLNPNSPFANDTHFEVEVRRICGQGDRYVVLADFGSGKSMSLREIFYLLRDEFIEKRHCRFPVYINLRDHAGAKYPDEILERHARDLGLSDFGQLVKAWRAGFIDLLLDGFDEFAAMGWSAMPMKLRQIRRTMLEAVRKLIIETPRSAGIVVVGREHYFDSPKEMRESLGLSDSLTLQKKIGCKQLRWRLQRNLRPNHGTRCRPSTSSN